MLPNEIGHVLKKEKHLAVWLYTVNTSLIAEDNSVQAKYVSVEYKYFKLIMLVFALSSLLAISTATAEWTCEDCNVVAGTIGTYLSSEESISRQIEVLIAEVCIIDPVPEDCIEQLPAFWPPVAMVLWPGYFNPEETWMCAQEGLCNVPDSR